MDLNFKQAGNWIKGNWYGIIFGYLIILVIVYLSIWAFLEPLDIPTKDGFLKSIFTTRWGNHLLLSLFIAGYITLILTIVFRRNTKQQFKNLKIVYLGTHPSPFDFKATKERKWDSKTNSRIGKLAEGEFTIISDVINIDRTNIDGQFELRLVNYTYNGNKTDFIKKDVTRDSNRNLRLKCDIKLSGNGSQEITFVLKSKDKAGLWLASKKILVTEKQWKPLDLYFTPSYDKDFFIRIDSRNVVQPPNSVQIRNLTVIEY